MAKVNLGGQETTENALNKATHDGYKTAISHTEYSMDGSANSVILTATKRYIPHRTNAQLLPPIRTRRVRAIPQSDEQKQLFYNDKGSESHFPSMVISHVTSPGGNFMTMATIVVVTSS